MNFFDKEEKVAHFNEKKLWGWGCSIQYVIYKNEVFCETSSSSLQEESSHYKSYEEENLFDHSRKKKKVDGEIPTILLASQWLHFTKLKVKIGKGGA